MLNYYKYIKYADIFKIKQKNLIISLRYVIKTTDVIYIIFYIEYRP